MKNIFESIAERLKSPVVLIEIIAIIGNLAVVLNPTAEIQTKAIITAITAIIAVFAGLNNPTEKDKF